MTTTETRMDDDVNKFEEFDRVDVADGTPADEVAELISEQFHDPTVTRVVAVFENDICEFDASDIGNIRAVDNAVHGMIRETPDVETIEQIRIRGKPWLADRIREIASMRNGGEATLHYESRFGGAVSKTIQVSEAGVEPAEEPYGVEREDERLDMAAAFGYKEDAEFVLIAQANGGLQVLMNDTRIVEPGTIPRFEVHTEEETNE